MRGASHDPVCGEMELRGSPYPVELDFKRLLHVHLRHGRGATVLPALDDGYPR
jgi:hypothetical protein